MTRSAPRLAVVLAALALSPGGSRAQAPPLFYEMDGTGPTIVFVPDWAQDTSIWFRVLPPLRRDFRLVRYDLRGQGRSQPPADGDYSLAAHREDLLRVMDSLGIERAYLVGAGLGGAVALAFALEHPERTRAVAAVNPHLVWNSEDRDRWARFLDGYERAGRLPLADYTSVLVERWFGEKYADREPWIVPFCDLMLRRQATAPLLASLRSWLGMEFAPESQSQVPLALVWGERVGPPAGEARLHGAFRVVRRERIEDAGWVPEVEEPREVARRVADFFGAIESEESAEPAPVTSTTAGGPAPGYGGEGEGGP